MIVLRYFWQNNYFSVIFVIFERDDEFNYYYIVLNSKTYFVNPI